MEDSRSSIDAIRSDIKQTRNRMGETVEALGAQLNPSRIKERVGESIHEATIGKVQEMANNAKDQVAKTGRGVASVVRENPIPAALIAGGLGWLLYKGTRYRNGNSHVIELSETTLPNVSDEGHSFQDANTVAENVGAGAREVGEKVAAGAKNVAAGAKNVAHEAQNVAHGVAENARKQAHVVGEKFDDSPMTLGAIALAVGLAVGFAVPITEKESRLMGSKRDDLMRLARDKVNDATQKVKHVAEETGPEIRATIEDAARNEGLFR